MLGFHNFIIIEKLSQLWKVHFLTGAIFKLLLSKTIMKSDW